MKQDLDKLLVKLKLFGDFFKKYHLTIFLVFFFSIYSFLVLQVNDLINIEPGPSTVNEQAVKRLKIDEDAVRQIEDLEEQNIEVRALFEDARNNPFNE